MPDIGYAGAALGAVSQALDAAKTLMELGKRLDNAEILSRVADLSLSLAEIKIQLAEALEERLQLQGEIEKLKSVAVMRKNLVRDGNVYKFREPVAGFGEGPFCMRCFDADGLLVNLVIYASMGGAKKWRCDECSRKGVQ